MEDSKTRFSARVENYVRYRPSYPAAVLDLLGVDETSVIADVGAGTGIFTRQLVEVGCHVFAVEPNADMLRACDDSCREFPNYQSIAAPAEATTLPEHCVNLVTAAQAFHWFDHAAFRLECQRILIPAGRVAIIWNDRLTDTTPFLRAYEDILKQYATDYSKVDHKNVSADTMRTFFGGDYTLTEFPNEQIFDLEGLLGRAKSSSYVPLEGHPYFEPVMTALAKAFEAHQVDGKISFEYRTQVYLGSVGQ